MYTGAVSGGGMLTQAGAGILTLLGSNTYTGGTTISAGMLQVGNGVVAGSITGSVVDNSLFVGNSPSNWTLSGAVSGSGSLIQAGPGSLTLAGSNTYTGGTTISGGTLQVGNGVAPAGIAGNVQDNGWLVMDLPRATTFGGVISGSGGLTPMGSANLVLTGSNNFFGGTTISAGTLQLGNGGTTGSLPGSVAIAAGGALALDRSDNLSLNNTLTGAGGLVKTDGDTVTLTGNVAGFTGPITVAQGQLVLTSPTACASRVVHRRRERDADPAKRHISHELQLDYGQFGGHGPIFRRDRRQCLSLRNGHSSSSGINRQYLQQRDGQLRGRSPAERLGGDVRRV